RRHGLQLRIREQHVLIARALDLESLGVEAEGGDVHEVVALVARKRDREAAALVRLGAPRNVAGDRGYRDPGAIDGLVVWSGDPPADDVRLGMGGGGRKRGADAGRGKVQQSA